MTKRQPVSIVENTYFDSQQVSAEDLLTEQTHNDQGQAAIINNHLGSGVLPAVLAQPVLLDTTLVIGLLDGKPIIPQAQPSDINLGVQLEIELSGALPYGKHKIKVAVLGLDFLGNLQYDAIFFIQNEKVVTDKHYTKVLSVLFNDALGAAATSYNLLGAGKVIIREASPLSLSRDVVMLAQDNQPNLFFRDFFLDPAYTSLAGLLTAAVPGYSTDGLNISTQYKQLRSLAVNDVVTQLGQKFQATTNNIQKLIVLLSVQNNIPADNNQWTGDLVVSIYPLQSVVTCSTDITPSLAINFSPSNIAIAQTSVNLTTLADTGVTLDGYLQPVDFVFSNTQASNSLIPGNFYAFTLKRSGSADKCNLQTAVGVNASTTNYETIFNGTTWTDVPIETLWFRILTDAAKVTDGQAYDAGQGVFIPKTATDPVSGATIDNRVGAITFSTTSPYSAIVKAALATSVIVQDQRTGNPVASRKQYVPAISLLLPADLAALQAVTEPVVLGIIQDKNIKAIDPSTVTSTYSFRHFGFFKNEIVVKINDINGDSNNNVALVTSLLNGDMNMAKIITDGYSPATFYRIARAEVQTMIYGDLDGNGVVDSNDLTIAQTLLNQSLVSSPTITGYKTNTNPFIFDTTATYQIINPNTLAVITSGTCQVLANSADVTITNIVANNVIDYTAIANILTYNFVVSASTGTSNIGTFSIAVVVNTTTLTIKKIYINIPTMLQILRADINGNFGVDTSDITYITNYVQKIVPFPASTSPGSQVGKTFRVLHLVLEQYIDRADDYPASSLNRGSTLHPIPDIALTDTSLLNVNYGTNPVSFSITKKLTWHSSLVITTGKAKQMPASFTYNNSVTNVCGLTGVTINTYPTFPSFDPGRNDFYVPNNLVIGNQLINPNGNPYKVDMEIGTVVLQIPITAFATDKAINLLSDVISDYSGTGYTRLGYPAMRFADCSTVSSNAILLNQIRFDISIQSYYDDGYADGYTGGNVKEGVYLDYTTGILNLNFSHLAASTTYPNTLSTKIQITVFLKKAGFNNSLLIVDPNRLFNILV